MKPLPDLSNTAAVIAQGRKSLLIKARNEAAEALRDCAVRAQGQDISAAGEGLEEAVIAIERLKAIAAMWNDKGSE